MTTPSISIVLPLYNKRRTVLRAIESALNQSQAPASVVVVDDGSSDGSLDVVRSSGLPVELVVQANAGPSAARNRGARQAIGDHLMFLDADDELLPTALQRHVQCLSQPDGTELSIGSFRRRSAEGVDTLECLADRFDGLHVDVVHLPGFRVGAAFNVHISGVCISKRLFDEVAGFDESLRCWEISDLLVRAGLRARGIAVQREALVLVHATPGNSQFERTMKNSGYLERFARKLVASLGEVPEGERAIVLAHAVSFSHSLLHNRALAPYRRMQRGLWRHLAIGSRFTRANWLCWLPLQLIERLLSLRSTRDGDERAPGAMG